ncbi:hypothetical protein [Campylobacter hepaticus]|uniref:hypothetical protein n=1 Tax=Campylobacter hepaticus TaxID=1813019 RepID=UPI001F0E366A|nr:hypothetical protein [Campylobacter hepaticus]
MKREEQIKNLKDFYDLVIIGRGSTGLALALDSSSRGYKTLLLERYDFVKVLLAVLLNFYMEE